MGCLYQIYNETTGSVYLGITIQDLKKRWNGHVKDAKSGSERIICRAIRKYGPESFTIEPLVKCDDQKILFDLEKLFIRIFKIEGRKLYNMTDGGEGTSGNAPSFTQEQKDKISKSVKLLWEDKDYREKATKNKSLTSKKMWQEAGFRIDHKLVKLTESDVLEIVDELKSGTKPRQLAERFNVNEGQISAIKNGRKWSWLTGIKSVDRNLNVKVTEKQADEMNALFQAGLSMRKIAKIFGVSHGTVSSRIIRP